MKLVASATLLKKKDNAKDLNFGKEQRMNFRYLRERICDWCPTEYIPHDPEWPDSTDKHCSRVCRDKNNAYLKEKHGEHYVSAKRKHRYEKYERTAKTCYKKRGVRRTP